MMAKLVLCDTCRGLRCWCCGMVCRRADDLRSSDKTVCEMNRIECLAGEGDGPVVGNTWSTDYYSRVARDSWNPV